MKVLNISLLRHMGDEKQQPVILCHTFDVSDFGYFMRGSVREMLTFVTRTVVQRTAFGQRQSVQHEEYLAHCYLRRDGLAGVVVTDKEYPRRVAFSQLGLFMEEFVRVHADRWTEAREDLKFPLPKLDEAIQTMQDPAKCDKVTMIHRELEETKEHVIKTMDSLLERGAKLDDLVAQSNDMSDRSKMFYRQAKKANSRCCVVQ